MRDRSFLKLIDRETELAGEAGVAQFGENVEEVILVAKPDAVGHQLVETKVELGGPATEGDDKLRIQEGFTAGETQHPDAGSARFFQESEGDRDRKSIGPLDRHAAMRAGEIALVGPGEG